MDNDKTYYFEYIGGYMIEGNKVVLRSLCDDKIITRVVHDEKENGLARGAGAWSGDCGGRRYHP